jgi:hypothetical protein
MGKEGARAYRMSLNFTFMERMGKPMPELTLSPHPSWL